MDLKEARGLWVDEQIFELQSQMAMVHRFLVKLGKVTSMDGRDSYCHSMLPTDQGMPSLVSDESENSLGVGLFPCLHEEEIESYSNLFHEEQVFSPTSVQFDPNSLPIFDTYEFEEEAESSSNVLIAEEWTAAVHKIEVMKLDPLEHQIEGPQSFLKGNEVPLIKGISIVASPAHSGLNAPEVNLSSPTASPQLNIETRGQTYVLWVYGGGLLDFYIEDDELKDKGAIDHPNSSIEHSCAKLEDLRTNPF